MREAAAFCYVCLLVEVVLLWSPVYRTSPNPQRYIIGLESARSLDAVGSTRAKRPYFDLSLGVGPCPDL